MIQKKRETERKNHFTSLIISHAYITDSNINLLNFPFYVPVVMLFRISNLDSRLRHVQCILSSLETSLLSFRSSEQDHCEFHGSCSMSERKSMGLELGIQKNWEHSLKLRKTNRKTKTSEIPLKGYISSLSNL